MNVNDRFTYSGERPQTTTMRAATAGRTPISVSSAHRPITPAVEMSSVEMRNTVNDIPKSLHRSAP